MFGSGYNPWRAKALQKAEETQKKAPWGRKLIPLPEGLDPKLLEDNFGDFNTTLYQKLCKESGFDKILLEERKKAAQRVASLPREKERVWYEYTDIFRGRTTLEQGTINVLKGWDKVDLELIVLREVQHPEREEFWEQLYQKIEELIGVRIKRF